MILTQHRVTLRFAVRRALRPAELASGPRLTRDSHLSLVKPHAEGVSPVVIQISRQEVTGRAPQRVAEIINSFIPSLLERNRNRVQLEVFGYGDDPRELFDIAEVRAYFRDLREIFPGMFYWLDTYADGFTFILMGLLLYTPIRVGNGQVTISSSDLQDFLTSGYVELNAFCKHYGISADATNRSIKEWLTRIFHQPKR